MDVFDIRDRLIDDYRSFTTAFVDIYDARVKQYVSDQLAMGQQWPEPWLSLNPAFESGGSVADLVREGLLDPECERIFRADKSVSNPGTPITFHRHQRDAIEVAASGQSYVLTTGTGSGKSLAYIVPIVNRVLSQPRVPGVKAIVVYPMNALANSQRGELKKFLTAGYGEGNDPVTFDRYTGQESDEDRERILQDPPDILLTNYVMLELVLTRPEERRRLVRAARGLQFLVLDELHTYRGRQGADVALLVRRVRDACTAPDLQCIGTSATMATGGSVSEQRSKVAEVATRLFGAEVTPNRVIGETLTRATAEPAGEADALRACVDAKQVPTSYDALSRWPLASWIEETFGLAREQTSGLLIRQRPQKVRETAAPMLAELTGLTVDACETAIQDTLLAGSNARNPREVSRRPLFAFRLHQFLSKGDSVYVTLEPEQTRVVTGSYQVAAPGSPEKLLYPLAFCRECGQEYAIVSRREYGGQTYFRARQDRDASGGDNFDGYLYISSDLPWPTHAVELAKVSLWLEAMEPGQPLAFLDAQIKIGNALIGATPALLDAGLPQEAFKPIEGDDKKIAAGLAKQNKQELAGQDLLFEEDDVRTSNADLAIAASRLVGAPRSLADVHVQQQRLRGYLDSPEYRQAKLQADAWCAAFVWPKQLDNPTCPTTAAIRRLRDEPASTEVAAMIDQLTGEYRFFHWHLEFPHLFPTERPTAGDSRNDVTGWYGGFTVVLGNPPWEHIELKEQEFFDARDADIATAAGAKRKRLIAQLAETNPTLHREFESTKRHIDGLRHFAAVSGRFPLCGRGRIKTDPVFAELGRHVLSSAGRFGLILPTGIATDATTQYFFRDVVESSALSSLYDFENRKPLFDGVDSRFKFCLLTLAGREHRETAADFAFFAHDPIDLAKPDVRFALTPDEITLLNPNTGTCPVFRSRRDAEITLGIYRRVPVLINENDPVNGNPWGIRFMQGLFNMTSDAHLFHTRDDLQADGWTLNGNVFEREISSGGGVSVEAMLPLYEAKMIHLYDTRWATYQEDGSVRDLTSDEKRDREFAVMPRYWVHESEIDKKLAGRWDKHWLLGWRDIARATDERSFIGAQLPRLAYNHKVLLALPARGRHELQAAMSSYVFDFAARQKMGGTSMGYFIVQQLPMPRPEVMEPFRSWIDDRVDRLNAQSLGAEEAADLKAALDARMFAIYGVGREDADYILETFPIVKRKDQAAYGEFRTKRLIMEALDQLETT